MECDLAKLLEQIDTCSLALMGQSEELAKLEDEARNKLEQVIKDGSALQCFATFIRFQEGNEELAFSPSKFPKSTYVTKMLDDKSGYIGDENRGNRSFCNAVRCRAGDKR